MLTKQGISVWSTEPGDRSFAYDDVSADVERELARVSVVEDGRGVARVAGYTVLHGLAAPERGVAYCDLPDGARALAETRDADWLLELERVEHCGAPVELLAEGGMRPA
jgi:hypothetical protein